jgi:hypothetical protein
MSCLLSRTIGPHCPDRFDSERRGRHPTDSLCGLTILVAEYFLPLVFCQRAAKFKAQVNHFFIVGFDRLVIAAPKGLDRVEIRLRIR